MKLYVQAAARPASLGRLAPLFVALSLLLSGCGDSPTGPDPDPPEPDPPSVELSVGLNLDNSLRSDTLTVAEGESVILEWSTNNQPASCSATGAWSGSKSTSGGGEVSEPLSVLGSSTFTLECENSAGSDRASVDVEVRSDETFHVRSDREDGSEANIHVVYAIPKDGEDRELDLSGRLETSSSAFRQWMGQKTGGYDLRMDTYQGDLDITFLRLSRTEAEIKAYTEDSNINLIDDEIRRVGFNSSLQGGDVYLVYYDGGLTSPATCGKGLRGGALALVNIEFCIPEGSDEEPLWADSPSDIQRFGFVALHELFHALGAVNPDAPNHNPENPGHVIDKSGDLMCSGPAPDGVDVSCLVEDRRNNGFIDYNNDDYFDPSGNLPEDVVNVAESPFVRPPLQ